LRGTKGEAITVTCISQIFPMNIFIGNRVHVICVGQLGVVTGVGRSWFAQLHCIEVQFILNMTKGKPNIEDFSQSVTDDSSFELENKDTQLLLCTLPSIFNKRVNEIEKLNLLMIFDSPFLMRDWTYMEEILRPKIKVKDSGWEWKTFIHSHKGYRDYKRILAALSCSFSHHTMALTERNRESTVWKLAYSNPWSLDIE